MARASTGGGGGTSSSRRTSMRTGAASSAAGANAKNGDRQVAMKKTSDAPTSRRTKAATVTKSSPRTSGRSTVSNRRSKAASSKVIYKDDSEEEDSSDPEEQSSDDYEEAEGDSDAEEAAADDESLDSEDLDASDDEYDSKRSKQSKGSSSRRKVTATTLSKRKRAIVEEPRKKPKKPKPEKDATGRVGAHDDDDDDYSDYTELESDSDLELEPGQEVAGRIYPAPSSGHVPPGRVSRNTFKFLNNMRYPERNDREWFKLHEPAYRVAEKEWVNFVAQMVPRFRQVDGELPALPPKDLIHRIYRDVRFSNDKTPYKKHFSASISRSGRKGIWAGYFVSIQPGGRSLIAGGVWQPGKDEIASIRHRIMQDVDSLKSVIEEPSFVKHFGPARPDGRGKGARCNVFGHDDMLKVKPKGVEKDHPSIDYLRLRSVAVVHNFTDKQVLAPSFMDKLMEVASAIRPLVHWINDAIAIPPEGPAEEE